jgi:hypothetical protein
MDIFFIVDLVQDIYILTELYDPLHKVKSPCIVQNYKLLNA